MNAPFLFALVALTATAGAALATPAEGQVDAPPLPLAASAEPPGEAQGATEAVPAAPHVERPRAFAAPRRVAGEGAPDASDADPRHALLAAAGSVAAGMAGLLGMVLYHRIRPNSALENDTRKSIFEAVTGNPGLGVQEISRLARVSYSTTTYHLERLVEAGMLVMTPDGNKLRFYKNGGAFTETERRLLPLVKNEEASRLLEAIVQRPGTYRAQLAELLGVTATTINWHLRRLRELGLIEETRQGRNAYLFARTAEYATAFRSLARKLGDDAPLVERLERFASAGVSSA